MTQEFIKENDYTISVVSENSTRESGVYRKLSLTRTFNFLSAQVTTLRDSCAYEGRGSSAGGSAAVSTQVVVENFPDIPSTGEIRLMHAKLVELGGKPPEIEEVLGGLNKKPLPLSPKGNA